MKAITLTVLVSLLVLSGLALAAQSGEHENDGSMCLDRANPTEVTRTPGVGDDERHGDDDLGSF